VPTLMLTGLVTLLHGRTRGHRSWTQLVGLISIVPVFWVAAFLALSYTNWQYYGVFTDLEIKSSEFKHAYSRLISVRSDQRQQYVMMEDAAKQAIAAESPAFAELAPNLRSGELAANFIWALRDSVQAAGYYDHAGQGDRENGRITLEFYRRLGDEVDAACQSGRLQCDRLLVPFIPAWQEGYSKALVPTFGTIFTNVTHLQTFEPRMRLDLLSSGSYQNQLLFSYMTHERVRTGDEGYYNLMPPVQVKNEVQKTKRLLRIGYDYYLNPAPWPFVIAGVGLVLALAAGAMRRQLAAGSVAALIVLSAMLSYISITTLVSVMAVTAHRYLHTSIGLMLLFTVTGWILLVQTIGSVWQRYRPG